MYAYAYAYRLRQFIIKTYLILDVSNIWVRLLHALQYTVKNAAHFFA